MNIQHQSCALRQPLFKVIPAGTTIMLRSNDVDDDKEQLKCSPETATKFFHGHEQTSKSLQHDASKKHQLSLEPEEDYSEGSLPSVRTEASTHPALSQAPSQNSIPSNINVDDEDNRGENMVHQGSSWFDESVTTTFPGAERVRSGGNGEGDNMIQLVSDNENILIGDDYDHETYSLPVHLLATAELVNDPIVAAEVGADNGTEATSRQLDQEQRRKRRQRFITTSLGLVVAICVTIVVMLLLDRGSSGNNGDMNSHSPTTTPSATPTATPTASPITLDPTASPTSQEEASLIALIQTRMQSTTFDNQTAPQGRALDWMLQDSFTMKLLADDNDDRVIQRFALAVFHYSTNGETDWGDGGWLEPSDECGWVGRDVKCTDNHEVEWLHLADDGLFGSLPKEIGLLTALTSLSLGENKLRGTIPSEIGLVSALTLLSFFDNELEGSIPSEIGSLSALNRLTLNSNENLEGTIPSEIGFLSALTNLDLHKNKLEGPVPSEVGLLPVLSVLLLRNNMLEGSVPTEVGLLTSLTTMNLRDNSLEGTMPTEVGLLSNVTRLSLSANLLQGMIPSEFGLCTDLTELTLYKNNLDGTIPSEMGLLTSLTKLVFASNYDLSGSIPTEFSNLSNLENLEIYSTSLWGSIPSNLCDGVLSRAVIDGAIECDCCMQHQEW